VANLPYEARLDSMAPEKLAIARAVAAEIPDHSSVFIDIGTTAEALAGQLLEKRGLRVVTNNINVVNLMAKKEDFEVVICGGTVRSRDLAVVGETTTEFVSRFQVDISILGVVAIGRDGSILDFSVNEAPLTQAIINCGRKCFVLADHTKFGRHAMAKVAHLSQVTSITTDTRPAAEWSEHLEGLGIVLKVASQLPTV
jgi:DeoR family glycerol-3-phosphate regulon repressor